jgi:hypothetical protein
MMPGMHGSMLEVEVEPRMACSAVAVGGRMTSEECYRCLTTVSEVWHAFGKLSLPLCHGAPRSLHHRPMPHPILPHLTFRWSTLSPLKETLPGESKNGNHSASSTALLLLPSQLTPSTPSTRSRAFICNAPPRTSPDPAPPHPVSTTSRSALTTRPEQHAS